jgi:hypothetical protein
VWHAKALGDQSANDPSKMTAKQMEKETDWVRAKDLDAFEGKRPQLFEGKIEPDDLCQGAVGNCWLVAAFACASEFPDCVRGLFLTKEYNPRGLYKVRIFDPVVKKWKIIKIDDRILSASVSRNMLSCKTWHSGPCERLFCKSIFRFNMMCTSINMTMLYKRWRFNVSMNMMCTSINMTMLNKRWRFNVSMNRTIS